MENQEKRSDPCTEFQDRAFSLFQETYEETLSRTNSLYVEPSFEFGSCKATKRTPFLEDNPTLLGSLETIVTSGHAKPVLVYGNSGVGKTSLGLKLCAHYWNKIEDLKRVPLFFPLQSLIAAILDQIEPSRRVCSEPVLLIIDTYETVLQNEWNVTPTNLNELFARFKDFQIVILCRADALPETLLERASLFRPRKILTNFIEVELKPFNPIQMNSYVTNFVSQVVKSESLEPVPVDGLDIILLSKNIYKEYLKDQVNILNKYLEYFKRTPDLYLIADTPMVLQTLLTVLPILLSRSGDHHQGQVTKITITDIFIVELFKFKADSYFGQTKSQRQPTNLQMTHGQLIAFFEIYSKNLASRFMKDSKLFDSVIENEETLRGTMAEPNYLFDEELLSLYKTYFEVIDNDRPELKTKKLNCLRVLRNACPLQRVGKKYYRFLHYSYEVYFAAKGTYSEIVNIERALLLKSETSASGLTFVKPIRDWSILNELAERVKLNKSKDVDILKTLIRLTVFLPLDLVGIVASNAASVLCQAGISFCKEDFRHSRLSEAFLNGGLFLGTDFRGSDLSHCTFQSAWLKSAQLQGSNLRDIDLGIGNNFVFDRGPEIARFWDVTSLSSFRCDAEGTIEDYWVTCFGNKIFQYHVHTQTLVEEVEVWEDKDFNVHGLHTLHCEIVSFPASPSSPILVCYCNNGKDFMVYSLPDIKFLYSFDIKETFSGETGVPRTSHFDNYFGILYGRKLVIFELSQNSATEIRAFELDDNASHRASFLRFTIQEDGLVYTRVLGGGRGSRIILNSLWRQEGSELRVTEFPFENITFFESCTSFKFKGYTWFLAGSSNGSIVYFRISTLPHSQGIIEDAEEAQGHSTSCAVDDITFKLHGDSEVFVASSSEDSILIWRIADKDTTLNVFRIISGNWFSGGSVSISPDCQSLGFAPARFNHFEVHVISALKKKPPRLKKYEKYSLPQKVRQLIILPEGDAIAVITNADTSLGFHTARPPYDIRGRIEFYDKANGVKKSTCICSGYIICGTSFPISSDSDSEDSTRTVLLGIVERVESVTYFSVCGWNQVIGTCKLTTRFVDVGKQAVINSDECWIALSESRDRMHDSIHFYKYECNLAINPTSLSCTEMSDTFIQLTLPLAQDPSRKRGALKVTTTKLFFDGIRKYLAFGTTGDELHIVKYNCEYGSFKLEDHGNRYIKNLGNHAVDIKSQSLMMNDHIEFQHLLVVATVMGIHILINTVGNSEWKYVKHVQSDYLIGQTLLNVNSGCVVTCGKGGILVKLYQKSNPDIATKIEGNVEVEEEWSLISHVKLFQTCEQFVLNQAPSRLVQTEDRGGTNFTLWFCGESTSSFACLTDISNEIVLLWSNAPSTGLVLNGCNIERSYGLTKNHLNILRDSGTVGSPIIELSQRLPQYYRKYSHISELFHEIPGTVEANHFSVIMTECGPLDLNENNWIISAVSKRQNILYGFLGKYLSALFSSLDCHVFIVVEGIIHHRRFIARADLVIDSDGGWRNKKHATISMFSWKEFEKFEKLAETYVAKQFCVTGDKGKEIIFKMYEDRWKKIPYSKLPHLKNWLSEKWFKARTLGKSKTVYFSCISWVDNFLSEHLGYDYVISKSKSWHNFLILLPSDVVHTNQSASSMVSALPASLKLITVLILFMSVFMYFVLPMFEVYYN